MAENWIKLTMKFPGKCLDCGKSIPKGQPGLWARGVGVKHVECAGSADAAGDNDKNDDNTSIAPSGIKTAAKTAAGIILCAICGKAAGCGECELLEICDLHAVSKNCLCHTCSQKADFMTLYRKAVSSKYAILSGASSVTAPDAKASRPGTLV